MPSTPDYRPFFWSLTRAGLAAVAFAGLLMFPLATHAARTIDSAALNGVASITVAPGATISAVVNVTTDGGGANARWRSTGWLISTTAPGAVTCVDHPNNDGAGSYSETFNITAPAGAGTYNAYFIAYNNDICSSGDSTPLTMTNAVIVTASNPVPTTSSISPASKLVGDAGFTMTVNGASFVAGSVVRFNGSDRTTAYVSPTQLTATIPASDMLTAGTFSITVFNPTPGGGTSNAQTFTVNNRGPTTTSISPAGKLVGDAGFTMTVNGASFVAGSVVRFNGSDRTTTYVSPTQLTATIPASDMLTAGTFNITVFNPTPGGGASNAQTFTVNNRVPITTSISPTSRNINSATFTLTVNGTNFVAGSVVRFAGSNRTTTYISATQLTATIPASDLTALGTFAITAFNPTPGGGTSNAQTLTVTAAAPTVTTDAATAVTASSVTMNGTVNTNGADITAITFQYGLTTAYGESITATPSSVLAGSAPYPNVPVSADEIELNCNTLFHYRIVATNSAGTTNGPDRTFTTGACIPPYPLTACAATRYGSDLVCTANDVNLTDISLAPGSISSCVSGTPVTLDLDLTVNFSSPDRYDVGIFIANDGKLPSVLPASGGAGSCSVDILPITTPPFGYTFPDLDGIPQGTADICGDGNSSINGGTGNGVKRMTGVTLPCYANPTSGGKLFVPFVLSWNNQKSPIGTVCTSSRWPVPGTVSKCNIPASTMPINVVVLPIITKTNGGTEINPGANTTYTITITNNSGGTLQDSIFKDPAVSDPLTPLTVNSISCASAGGATCPAMTSAAMISAMQGPTGITIPSASLPNDGSLTFTMYATLSGAATVGRHLINTASVTIGGFTTSATDDDLIVIAPSVGKSFSPNSITEDAASLLTITLSNPGPSAITGVSFTDTYPAGMVNTASASGATTCGGTVTAIDDDNSVALSGGTIQAGSSCTVTVYVTSATAGGYTNSTGTVTTDSGTISAASATLTVNVAVYGAFNACDVGTPCTNTTTITDSHIATKVAGSAFSLDIVALKSNGTRNMSYSNDVIVQLLDASNNSGTLDSSGCRSTWTVIATLSPNPQFGPSDNGLIAAGPFSIPEAYRDVRVLVTNNGGASRVGCSTNNFAIRPNNLLVSPTDADWQTAGTARALTNTNVLGATVHKAGQPFTVTATARNASNVTTLNYAGTPALTVSACSPGTACAASLGTFALGTAASFTSGVLTSNLATYSEAGSFDLTLQDGSFAQVDADDTAADCTSAGRYICGTASVGRFVPDHFNLTGSITPADPNGFTYMGVPFTVSLTLTAMNANDDLTANYATANGFAKLDPATASWLPAGLGTNASFGLGAKQGTTDLSSRLSVSGTPAGTWTGGITTITATLIFSRPTSATADATWGSYETLDIGIAPQDADGVKLLPGALDLDVDGDASNERRKMTNTTRLRFGRIWLGNACGSDKLDLAIPFRAEYWNGNVFITNADDSSTSIAGANIGLGNHRPAGFDARVNLANIPPGPFPVAGGLGSFTLAKPTAGAPAAGSVDIVFALGPDTTTNTSFDFSTAQPPSAGANLTYLRGKWYGANPDRDPAARAAFGIFCGGGSNKGPIYIRENY